MYGKPTCLWRYRLPAGVTDWAATYSAYEATVEYAYNVLENGDKWSGALGLMTY
jgi:hypothetical protein